jgi:hypothetical protein
MGRELYGRGEDDERIEIPRVVGWDLSASESELEFAF